MRDKTPVIDLDRQTDKQTEPCSMITRRHVAPSGESNRQTVNFFALRFMHGRRVGVFLLLGLECSAGVSQCVITSLQGPCRSVAQSIPALQQINRPTLETGVFQRHNVLLYCTVQQQQLSHARAMLHNSNCGASLSQSSLRTSP